VDVDRLIRFELSIRYEVKKMAKLSKISAKSDDYNEEEVYVVETILDKRIVNGRTEYLLKWKGYGE
jgi:hypothetical protein